MRTAILLAVILACTQAYAAPNGTPQASQPAAGGVSAGSGTGDTAPAAKTPETANTEPGPPATTEDAVALAKDTFSAGKAKNWWLVSAGVIWLVMFGLKLAGLFKKMGKRWAYIVVGVLSMAAMLTAKFGAGASWERAIAVMTSGPFVAFANDFFKRGILGKEPATSVGKS
jgi:hypothetical protein